MNLSALLRLLCAWAVVTLAGSFAWWRHLDIAREGPARGPVIQTVWRAGQELARAEGLGHEADIAAVIAESGTLVVEEVIEDGPVVRTSACASIFRSTRGAPWWRTSGPSTEPRWRLRGHDARRALQR